MEIQNARYTRNMGYAELHVQIDGREANIPLEQKPTTYQNGLIFLGPNFEDVMPVFELNGTALKGFTDDPEILRLYNKFVEDANSGSFTPGPVEV